MIGTLVLIFACCNCGKIDDGVIPMFFLDKIFEFGTTQEPITEQEFFEVMFRETTPNPNFIENFQGVEFDVLGYKEYYLRYEVNDIQELLDFISSMPAGSFNDIQTTKCSINYGSGEKKFYSDVKFIDLDSLYFWHPEEISEKEFYDCYRTPWGHTILEDKNSNVVYHVVIETMRD